MRVINQPAGGYQELKERAADLPRPTQQKTRSHLDAIEPSIDPNYASMGDLYTIFDFLEQQRRQFSPALSDRGFATVMILDFLNAIGLIVITIYASRAGRDLAKDYHFSEAGKEASETISSASYYLANVFVQHGSNLLMVEFVTNLSKKYASNKLLPNGKQKNANLMMRLLAASFLTVCATIAVLKQNLDAHLDMAGGEIIVGIATTLKAIQLFRGIVYFFSMLFYTFNESFVYDTWKTSVKGFIRSLAEETIPLEKTYENIASQNHETNFIQLMTHNHGTTFTLHPAAKSTLWFLMACAAGPYAWLGYGEAMSNFNGMGGAAGKLSWVTFAVMLCLFTKSNVSVISDILDSSIGTAHCYLERRAGREPHIFYRDREPSTKVLALSVCAFFLGIFSLGGAAEVAATESGSSMETKIGWWKGFAIALGIVGINWGDSYSTFNFAIQSWTTYLWPKIAGYLGPKTLYPEAEQNAKAAKMGGTFVEFIRKIGGIDAPFFDKPLAFDEKFREVESDEKVYQEQSFPSIPLATIASQLWMNEPKQQQQAQPTSLGSECMEKLSFLHKIRNEHVVEKAYQNWLTNQRDNAEEPIISCRA